MRSCKLQLNFDDQTLATLEKVVDDFKHCYSDVANLLDDVTPTSTSSPL